MRSRRIAIKLSLLLAVAGLTTSLAHATVVAQYQFEASGVATHSGTGNAATGVDTYLQFTLDTAGTLTVKVDNVFSTATIATSVNAVDFHLTNGPSNSGTILNGGSFVSCSPVGTCGGTTSTAPTGWALTLPTTSNFNLTDTNVGTADKITSTGPYQTGAGTISTTEAPWFATNRIGAAFPDFSGTGTATTFILTNAAFANLNSLAQIDNVTVFFGDVNNGSNFLSDTALEPEPTPLVLIGTGLLAIAFIKRKYIE
jgi:hypothetical protein